MNLLYLEAKQVGHVFNILYSNTQKVGKKSQKI